MGEKKKPKASKAPKARAKRRRPLMRKGYVCECGVCGNGLVRFFTYCDAVVGLCDECECVWQDVAGLAKHRKTKADGSFPGGPDRQGQEGDWGRATRREVERAGLENCIEGYSD